jgi:hypothetical protein
MFWLIPYGIITAMTRSFWDDVVGFPLVCFASAAIIAVVLVGTAACGGSDDEPSTRVSNVRLYDITSPLGVRCVVAESRYRRAGIAMACDWEP